MPGLEGRHRGAPSGASALALLCLWPCWRRRRWRLDWRRAKEARRHSASRLAQTNTDDEHRRGQQATHQPTHLIGRTSEVGCECLRDGRTIDPRARTSRQQRERDSGNAKQHTGRRTNESIICALLIHTNWRRYFFYPLPVRLALRVFLGERAELRPNLNFPPPFVQSTSTGSRSAGSQPTSRRIRRRVWCACQLREAGGWGARRETESQQQLVLWTSEVAHPEPGAPGSRETNGRQWERGTPVGGRMV